MSAPVKPPLQSQLAVAADFLEEHGFPPEVLLELRRRAQALPEESPWLNCFRVAVRSMPFGRMGGEVMGMTLQFDPQMIEYGIMRAGQDRPFSLTGQIGYMVENLQRQCTAAIMDYLEKRGHR